MQYSHSAYSDFNEALQRKKKRFDDEEESNYKKDRSKKHKNSRKGARERKRGEFDEG